MDTFLGLIGSGVDSIAAFLGSIAAFLGSLFKFLASPATVLSLTLSTVDSLDNRGKYPS